MPGERVRVTRGPAPVGTPEQGPELTVIADLERTGLTAATDTEVHVPEPVRREMPRIVTEDEVTVRTAVDDGTGRGRLGALIVAVLVVVVLVLISVFVLHGRSGAAG
jgi:hypothetical protein